MLCSSLWRRMTPSACEYPAHSKHCIGFHPPVIVSQFIGVRWSWMTRDLPDKCQFRWVLLGRLENVCFSNLRILPPGPSSNISHQRRRLGQRPASCEYFESDPPSVLLSRITGQHYVTYWVSILQTQLRFSLTSLPRQNRKRAYNVLPPPANLPSQTCQLSV